MSGKDRRKSAVHFTARNLSKEINPGSDAHMEKVGSVNAGRKYIVQQLLRADYKRLSSREFVNPHNGRVRILPR